MAVYELNVSYEIKCNNKFSWSYVYVDDGRTCEIWADSIEALKEKVKNEFLPWDDNKIPKEKEIPKVKKTYSS